MSENLDLVCGLASAEVSRCSDALRKRDNAAIAALRAEFAELERKAASAIIPTPELREAVKTVCLAAEGEIRMSEICGCPHDDVSESRIESDVATVRAAFKENDNE